MRTLLRKAGLCLLVASFMSSGICGAAVPEAAPGVPAPATSGDAALQGNGAPSENQEWLENRIVGQKDLQIICGNSRVIHLNREVMRLAIPEPEIADAVVVNKQEILITTKKKGAANLLVWDKEGNIYSYNVTVVGDPTTLKSALEKISPQNKVDVYSTEKGYVVRGNVGTVEVQKQIAEASKAFSSESVSIVTVNEAKQILLEIRVIEIDRSKGLDFGIDGELALEKFGFLFMPGGLGALKAVVPGGSQTAGVINPNVQSNMAVGAPSEGVKIGGYAAGYHSKNWSIDGVIKALETQSSVKVLARPNILVRDGSKANLLVGGEFPIPEVTSNSTNVTYKEFGTKLTYTPSILNSGKIRFDLQTEVSELDPANGIQANGFTMPAITSRKAETTVEIDDNKTLMLGGMIQQRAVRTESGTPYLRRIPWVGKLFQSVENRTDTIELVIFITPHILEPQKEQFDLKTLAKDDPRFTLNELPDPPFENAKALAMEEYLTRFESERKTEDGIELRKFKRDALRQQYRQEDQELFKKEADRQEAVAKAKALKEEARKAHEKKIAAKKEAAEKAKEQALLAQREKERQKEAEKEKALKNAAEKGPHA